MKILLRKKWIKRKWKFQKRKNTLIPQNENGLWCVYEYKNGTWWIASQYHVDRCWFDKWFSSEKLKEVVEMNFKLISKSKWVWSCIFEMVDEEWKTIDNNIDMFSTLQCWISKMLFKVLPTPKLEEYNLTDFS